MRPDIREVIKKKRLWFAGATGTVLQSMDLPAGEAPEKWNLLHPDVIESLHRAYIDAGCNIIKTNTFGVNPSKYENWREMIAAAMKCARAARGDREDVYIAFDIGPTGRLCEPLGDLPFEEAVALFSECAKAGAEEGADLILIETMNDCTETKAAVVGAKEACSLPVFVTNVYDESGRLMTGATPAAMAAMLEGLRVDAIGANCSLGPDLMLPVIKELAACSSVPVIANPNAGMPDLRDGVTRYEMTETDFAASLGKLAEAGAGILGGCCGTTPGHISAAIAAAEDLPFVPATEKDITVVSSYASSCVIGGLPVMIGERINPTGKPLYRDALRRGDLSYAASEAVREEEAGADVLDINVGLPGIDEADMMKKTVAAVQAVSSLPLQIDSASAEAVGAALRIYSGKPLVNSVSGEKKKTDAVFPLVAKYGGVVVCLTMDENGIPGTAQERVEIALKIAKEAEKYGIRKKDLIFDTLTMAVSADPDAAAVTLDAAGALAGMGFKTVLGVSNVSFGLPQRDLVNAAFLSAALGRGLSAAIVNPFSEQIRGAFATHGLLSGTDPACSRYIGFATACAGEKKTDAAVAKAEDPEDGLKRAVKGGLSGDAVKFAGALLDSRDPLDIINGTVIPALEEVGAAFGEKRAYLPQLLMSAEAAVAAINSLKSRIGKIETAPGREVILATVRGDIHDIGKNIVKVMFESHGWRVYDLGRDVPPEKVLECVKETGCRLVGLSALMTTTMPAMEETVKLIRSQAPGTRVMVGGAVLTAEYAEMMGADAYAADASEAVAVAEKMIGK